MLALTKVYDPFVIKLAASYAILLSFCPKFAAIIEVMPAATIGGVSIILYGMISAIGVRNVVENKTNFQESRNVIVAAIILGLAVGINFSEAAGIPIVIGRITINMTGLAVASIVGISYLTPFFRVKITTSWKNRMKHLQPPLENTNEYKIRINERCGYAACSQKNCTSDYRA